MGNDRLYALRYALIRHGDGQAKQVFSCILTLTLYSDISAFVNALESAAGLLTISNKRCPHLGCALKWNKAEHSWDCPCHGSRFDEDGKVLDNPANG